MNKRYFHPIVLLVFWFFSLESNAQVNIKDSVVFTPMIQISYSYQIAAGDLMNRFGNNSNIGLSFLIKNKNNWIYGIDGSFIFGNEIKENQILKNISTNDGYIITSNGQFADVKLFERGYTAQVRGGRLFPVLSPNPNSGIFCTLGVGFLQHKIRIENTGNTAPQLSVEYKKGYDRLSNGIAFSEFLGYTFLSNNRRVNFYFGLELYQALTKNRRTYNYDLMEKVDVTKQDFLNGFRIGWVIPLYEKLPNEYYYR